MWYRSKGAFLANARASGDRVYARLTPLALCGQDTYAKIDCHGAAMNPEDVNPLANPAMAACATVTKGSDISALSGARLR
jgi:hypothetical protein